MPKTKITLNKGRKCPFCPYRFIRDDELAEHIGNCSQNLLFCNYCNFSSTAPKNLRRHLKRQHEIGEENSTCTSGEADGLNLSSAHCDGNESDAEYWVRQDPGDLQSVLQEDISDGECDNNDSAEARSKKKSMSSKELQLEEGRIYRKPTRPLPVSVPLKAATNVVTPPCEPAADKPSFVDKECQTDPLHFTESVKIITKLIKDGRRIKKIEKKKLL